MAQVQRIQPQFRFRLRFAPRQPWLRQTMRPDRNIPALLTKDVRGG
jgi:hypothetical protein